MEGTLIESGLNLSCSFKFRLADVLGRRTFKFVFAFILVSISYVGTLRAQRCPATGVYSITTDINWSAILDIGTCNSALITAGGTFTGNVFLDYANSNDNVTFNVNNLTINGNLDIKSTSNGNVFTIAPYTTLTVIGDMGNPTNNNLTYSLGVGSVLIVTGTLYGKNSNTITGTGGVISAGSLNFDPGNLDCVSGCPTISVSQCTDLGTACAANNSGSSICSTNYGGSVTGSQSTCGSSIDPTVLTASGSTGIILRWESSINGGLSWTGINNIGTTYDPPSVTTTTLYRVVVLNTSSGACISYSSAATVNVGVPSASGVISGPASVCQSSSGVTYSVVAISGATSYTWSYSGTGTTISGSTNPITMTFSGTATSGVLTVTGTNSCGSGTVSSGFNITVNSGIAPSVNAISNVTGCVGASIPLVTVTGTLTGITWTSSNTSIGNLAASGNDNASPFEIPTFTATNLGQNPITSTITVTPTGACGSGAPTTYTYTIYPISSITSVTGTSPLCIGNTATYTTNVLILGNGTGAWSSSNPAVATVNSSSGLVTALGAGTTNITYTITGGCGGLKSASQSLTVTAANTAGAASSTPAVCISTALTAITHTTTGATGIGTPTGLPAGVTAAWASNTITISGTPTVAGTFNYSIPLTGGCGTVNATGTITVNANRTATAASSTPTVCISTALTAITHTTTGATGIGTVTNLPAGVTAAWASNTITISGTPTAAGTFNYTINLAGGCGTANASGTITVTANMTAGAASSTPTLCINTALTAITHTTTLATGIGTATGLPAGVTAAWAANTITISGTPTASGIFTYSIPLTGGCGTVNATGTITVTANRTASAASSTPTLCINSALTAITHSTTGATGIGTSSGLPAGVTAAWASNTITISGTPTAAGTFNYTINLAGGCGTANATGTITVTANNTSSAASSAPTLCIGTALMAITHSTTGATGIGTPTGLPAGVTAAWAGNTITISGTPTASGPFSYTIPLTGGCGTVNATGTITVTANMTVSAASSTQSLCTNSVLTNITHTTTLATGISNSGVSGANGLPAGVSATWVLNSITISGTPTAAGTFNYSIPLTGGCGAVAATGTIIVSGATSWTGAINNDWSNDGNWTCGKPTVTRDATLTSGTIQIPSGSFDVRSLTIPNGAIVDVLTGATLNIYGDLTNDGTMNIAGTLQLPSSTGTSTYDADGSSNTGVLKIISTSATLSGSIGAIPTGTTFTGKVTVQRHMGSAIANKSRYISMPVTGMVLNVDLTELGLSSGGFVYNEAVAGTQNNGWTQTSKSYAFQSGLGFASYNAPVSWEVQGPLTSGSNRGDVALPVSYTNTGSVSGDGWNLVGNPYPAAIQWNNTDWTNNATSKIDPIVYVQDVVTGVFLAYNRVTLTGTPGFNGIIALGQAFWVKANAASPALTVKESAKNTSAATFYRKSAASIPSLNIALTQGDITDYAALVLHEQATDWYDQDLDAFKLEGDRLGISLISKDNEKLVQYSTNEIHDQNIQINIMASDEGKFSIHFESQVGAERFQDLYLIDAYTQTVHPVNNTSPYEFMVTQNVATKEKRFFLSRKPDMDLNQEVDVMAYPNPTRETLNIEISGAGPLGEATLYDANGKVMNTISLNRAGLMNTADLPSGMYILKVKTTSGVVIKKIMRTE